MRWLILEDALKDKRGHYFEYISTFKRGLEACGDNVAIFTDRTAEPWIAESLNSSPVLPRCIWRRMNDGAPRWKKLLRYPLHGWQTFVAWLKIFGSSENVDVVFVPSVFTHHLLGIVPFLLICAKRMNCKFLLFFPSTPICFDEASRRPQLKPNPTAALFPWLLQRLKPLVVSGKVVLGVETRSMKDALEDLVALPFHYMPHPVSVKIVDNGDKANNSFADERGEILVGSYGGSRFEKGSDLLQTAVKKYLEVKPDPRVRFAIQWINDFRDASGELVSKDLELQSHPQVKFITDYFDPDGGYMRALHATRLMLLPYRASYRYRLSRVVIEAMMAGMPVAVPKETTLAEQAVAHGACVLFEQESVDSLANAIEQCVRCHDELRQKALSKAADCAEHFSVRQFRQTFLRVCTDGAD